MTVCVLCLTAPVRCSLVFLRYGGIRGPIEPCCTVVVNWRSRDAYSRTAARSWQSASRDLLLLRTHVAWEEWNGHSSDPSPPCPHDANGCSLPCAQAVSGYDVDFPSAASLVASLAAALAADFFIIGRRVSGRFLVAVCLFFGRLLYFWDRILRSCHAMHGWVLYFVIRRGQCLPICV